MKRWGAFAIALAAIVMGVAQPAVAEPSTSGCSEADCGNHQTECWTPYVRARPGHTRHHYVGCQYVTGARLTSPPPHGTLTNLQTHEWGLNFDLRPDEDAPRIQEAQFEVEGKHGTIAVTLEIETFPLSENTPPSCGSMPVSRRTDGLSTVDLDLSVWCYDTEHDEFTMEGGGPGTHLDSPASVGSNTGTPQWRYRTATSSGTETTHVWATDYLGARSQDAAIDVTIGPNVDRLPVCGYGYPLSLFARPGAVRRFGFDCSDADGDPFVVAMSDPPERGAVVAAPDPLWAYPGYQSIDGTYAPTSDGTELDDFAFTPSGVQGDGPEHRVTITPRALPENGGGYCFSGGSYVTEGAPGKVSAVCFDDEGDPLTGEITTQPKHGTAGPPVAAPGHHGADEITIPYVPDAGFIGYDCLKVKVSDGHGFETEIVVDIWVQQAIPDPPPWGWGPMPPMPPMFPPGGPFPPSPQNVRLVAQQALGTGSVKRVSRGGGVEVWARSKLSKTELLRERRSSAMVVICMVNCQIRSDAALAGLTGVKAARRKASAARTPGQSHVVTLDLTKREQRALRRARKPRASFKLSVRPAGGKAQPVRRAIPIGR